MLITDIYQYPVKGLSEDSLTQIELVANAGMPADRLYAITHGKSQFDHANPAWVRRRNFAVIAHSPEIGPIQCQFDLQSKSLTLKQDGNIILQEHADSENMDAQLTAALNNVITTGQSGPYQLVTLGHQRLTDNDTPTVSILNTKSLAAVEEAVGKPLEKRRFRGNFWFEGDHAWQEHDWIGKTICIGGVKLFVTQLIERCAAVDADPELGVRNLSVLKQLNTSFGHVNFGVLAEVDATGTINIGDRLAH